MSLRLLTKRFLPFATKQRVLGIINPVLRSLTFALAVRPRLAQLLQQHRIEYLDLGGWMPVEGWLTIHLSSVELYAVPSLPTVTHRQVYDERTGCATLERRELTAPAVSLHYDVLAGLPLADASLRGVNLSHFLEHFPLAQGAGFIRECYRVVQPGGVVRVSCPDLRKYARAYVSRDEQFFKQTAVLAFCRYQNLETFGDRFISKAYDDDNGHQWFYDAESVIHLLKRAGFSRAEERPLHQSALPAIQEIEPAYREPESFYVEGVR
jgi:predicted SAM-dependent methyltransferase